MRNNMHTNRSITPTGRKPYCHVPINKLRSTAAKKEVLCFAKSTLPSKAVSDELDFRADAKRFVHRLHKAGLGAACLMGCRAQWSYGWVSMTRIRRFAARVKVALPTMGASASAP